MEIEREYCLICRSEIPTESGMVCSTCATAKTNALITEKRTIMDYRDWTFLTIVLSALFAWAGTAHADVDIDMGELGSVSLHNALIPAAKQVLDRTYPPDIDEETGEIIPKSAAQYKRDMVAWIHMRSWDKFKKAVAAQYFADNPVVKPDIDQYMVYTPAAP